MELITILKAAFEKARDEERLEADRKALHLARSKAWVTALANELRKAHASYDGEVRVLSCYDKTNKHDFGVEELLHDISVFTVSTVPSSTKRTTLYYVKEPLWQVESVFARDTRKAMYDFNKLILGSAPNKLFIGSITSSVESYIEVFRQPAARCSGTVHLALVPHPDSWDKSSAEEILLLVLSGAWERVGRPLFQTIPDVTPSF